MISGTETRTSAINRLRAMPTTASPRTGSAAAPVLNSLPLATTTPRQWRSNSGRLSQSSELRTPEPFTTRRVSMDETISTSLSLSARRLRSGSDDPLWPDLSPSSVRTTPHHLSSKSHAAAVRSRLGNRNIDSTSTALAKAKARNAQKTNDAMVYLDGPQVYACAQCRTHLTSHDDIISKSFHGRHGRAYLFDQCVNVTIGPAEDRALITGLHSVSDIFCKRCKNMVGWTYAKAYESSQKYKEGKFIIEKINLHLEESGYYDVDAPAGERVDRWRRRSMSWGSEDIVYEYEERSSRTLSWDKLPASIVVGSCCNSSRESCYEAPVGMPDAPVL